MWSEEEVESGSEAGSDVGSDAVGSAESRVTRRSKRQLGTSAGALYRKLENIAVTLDISQKTSYCIGEVTETWTELKNKFKGENVRLHETEYSLCDLNAIFYELMQECRHSAPGARLSARLRTTLERLPPATRRALVSRTRGGCAPLFVCARRGNAELAEYLVHVCDAGLEQRGIYEAPDERTRHRVSPLWCAAVAGRLTVLRVLADAGADLNAGSDSGSTPVRSACFMTHEAVVWELVERGADIHRANHNGGTCLINSVQSARLCAYLLSKGAAVDACDLQHKTALHYAAQEHRADTARLLLDHGADAHRVSRAGDDVLRTAALKGAAHIVSLLAYRLRYPESRLADAYELLGATQLDEFNDLTAAMTSWRRATAIRHNPTGYIEKLPKRPPRSALCNAKEWRTNDQLELAGADIDALRVQALLVADRVLGPSHKDTMFRLMYRGVSYVDAYRYQRSIDLWTWVLEIRIERDTLLHTDTWQTACALTRLMLDTRGGRLEGGRGVPKHRDVVRVFDLVASQLPDARRMLETRPIFRKQAETFDLALRCVTHLIFLMLDTAETQEEQASVHQNIWSLVAKDVRSVHTGDTLLHLCVSRLNIIKSSYFADELAAPYSEPIFPSIPVTQLLTRCGADPVQRNKVGSTALHVAAIPYNYSPELLKCLLAAGGHLDQVNCMGGTALRLVIAQHDHQLYPLRHITLGCLAARALLSARRYSDIAKEELPATLFKFLELHCV